MVHGTNKPRRRPASLLRIARSVRIRGNTENIRLDMFSSTIIGGDKRQPIQDATLQARSHLRFHLTCHKRQKSRSGVVCYISVAHRRVLIKIAHAYVREKTEGRPWCSRHGFREINSRVFLSTHQFGKKT